MEITCRHCGERIGIEDDTPEGQKVRCPFCNEKFFYKEERYREEITEEDLATSLAACRRDPDKEALYSHAPEGARLYIALEFYGLYYGKQINVENYMAAFIEIEPLFEKQDLSYLFKNETSPDLRGYFQDLAYRKGYGSLEDERKVDEPIVGRENRQGRPTVSLGIIRPAERKQASTSPVARRRPKKRASMATINGDTGHGISGSKASPLALGVAAVAVVILLVLVFEIVIRGCRPQVSTPVEPQKPEVNVTALQDDYRAHVESALEKLAERQAVVKKSLQELRNDIRTLTSEIDRTVEKGNMKAAEAAAKRQMRLSKAETSLAILRMADFNRLACRYLNERPQTSAAACRRKVEEAIAEISSDKLTDSDLAALDQIAVSYQEMCVGTLRRSMREKERELTDLSRMMRAEIGTLVRVKNDAYYLAASEVPEKEKELETRMNGDVFVSECRLPSVENVDVCNPNAEGKDEFDLSRFSRAGGNDNSPEPPEENEEQTPSLNDQRLVPESTPPPVDEPTPDKAAEEQNKANNANKPDASPVSPMPSGGRRQRCRSPAGLCMNFAERGHNFCSEHECHSYGCKEHVCTFSSPNWVRGGFGAVVNQCPELRDYLRHKTLGHFCKKHCCTRVCPQPKNYHGWWEDWMFWRGQNVETFFFCDNERLANSRYCGEHSCKVPTCSACCEERWQLDNGSNGNDCVSRITPRDGRDWVLIAAPMCFSHRNVDPESVRPRDLRTEGDLKKERDER